MLPGTINPMFFAARSPFEAGNQSHASLLAFGDYLAGKNGATSPTAGGTLTINGNALGSYDYVYKFGNQNVTTFNATDWFTTAADSRSAIIVVIGNLTIDAAVVFRPSVRKLFTMLYVTGNLTIAGSISMSQRGANHSATGSNIAAADIRIATGTFSGVSNPQIPATGASGATGVSNNSGNTTNGNNGADGANGQSGGGASGGANSAGGGTSSTGNGANGTCFSGGPGSGGCRRNSTGSSAAGGANGAAGSNGNSNTGSGAGGGAGNPAGSGANGAPAGTDGTGGTLIIFCKGTLSGAGTVVAAGSPGGAASVAGGGASGGGSITMMNGSDTSSITPTALGGAVAGNSGRGGNGTARKLAL